MPGPSSLTSTVTCRSSDRVVRVATNVYSVGADKLVWASESETFNPASLREAITEVVRVTAKATGEALRTRG